MTSQQYLKAIRNDFLITIDSLSSIMEKNAMNIAPSEAETKRLQEQLHQIETSLYKMYHESTIHSIKFEKEYDTQYQKSCGLTICQTALYSNMDSSRKLCQDLEIQLANLNAQKDTATKNLEHANKKIGELNQDLNNAIRKHKEREDKLKKWFWVPGYGLYLSIDYLSNDIQSKINTANRERDVLEGLYQANRQKVAEVSQAYASANEEYQTKQKQLVQINKDIDAVTQNLLETKQQLVYWEDLCKQLQDLRTKFEIGKSAPDVLVDVLDILEVISSAA